MPSSKIPDKIPWLKSEARKALLEDLESGRLSLDADEVSAEEAWPVYRFRVGFKGHVGFPQFKAQLTAHRSQVSRKAQLLLEKRRASLPQQQDDDYDHQLHRPESTTQHSNSSKGELMFDRSPAKRLLRHDVKNGIHLRLSVTELWLARPEYQQFSKKAVFKQRIEEEIRQVNHINYLNTKRAAQIKQERTARKQAAYY